MEQIEQAVMYALGPQVDPNLKAQVNHEFLFSFLVFSSFPLIINFFFILGKCLL